MSGENRKKIPPSVAIVFIPVVIFFFLFFAIPTVSESFFGVSVKKGEYDNTQKKVYNAQRMNNEVVFEDNINYNKKQSLKIERNNTSGISESSKNENNDQNLEVIKIEDILPGRDKVMDSETSKKVYDFLNELNTQI